MKNKILLIVAFITLSINLQGQYCWEDINTTTTSGAGKWFSHFGSSPQARPEVPFVVETQALQQQKIEELTLYTIQQNTLLQQQAAAIAAQAAKQAELELLVQQLLLKK